MKKCKMWEAIRKMESFDLRISELSDLIARKVRAGADVSDLAKELAEVYDEKRAFGRITIEIGDEVQL